MSIGQIELEDEPSEGEFNVTIRAQLLHGALWAARQRLGSNAALAEHLGVDQGLVGRWLSLKDVPSRRLRNSVRWEAIEQKLMALTGESTEKLFPQVLSSQDFLDQPKVVELTRSISLSMLYGALTPQALPLPDEMLEQTERQELLTAAMQTAIHSLSTREARILNLLFGLDGAEPLTLRQVGDLQGVGAERIRQIEARALRKLRRTTRNRKLRMFVE